MDLMVSPTSCRINTPNYRKIDGSLEINFYFIWKLIKHRYWMELNWISLFKVSNVIIKLHNSSHLLKVCLNNANRPKLVMIITIKKRIRILKRMFEQNRRKNLYVRTFYVTDKIFVYYKIVRLTLLGQYMSYIACRGMPLVSIT